MAKNLLSQIRTIPATTALATSMAVYGVSEKRLFPTLPEPLDMNESGRHMIAGFLIGLGARLACSRREVKNAKAMVYGISTSWMAGTLFETGIVDHIYRHNTASLQDIIWTTIAGAVGTLCVKSSQEDESNNVETI